MNSKLPTEAFAITKGLAAEQVYLFGSHVRGGGTPDSDLDFLVVVSQSMESCYERAVAALRVVDNVSVSQGYHRAHPVQSGRKSSGRLVPFRAPSCGKGFF